MWSSTPGNFKFYLDDKPTGERAGLMITYSKQGRFGRAAFAEFIENLSTDPPRRVLSLVEGTFSMTSTQRIEAAKVSMANHCNTRWSPNPA